VGKGLKILYNGSGPDNRNPVGVIAEKTSCPAVSRRGLRREGIVIPDNYGGFSFTITYPELVIIASPVYFIGRHSNPLL